MELEEFRLFLWISDREADVEGVLLFFEKRQQGPDVGPSKVVGPGDQKQGDALPIFVIAGGGQ